MCTTCIATSGWRWNIVRVSQFSLISMQNQFSPYKGLSVYQYVTFHGIWSTSLNKDHKKKVNFRIKISLNKDHYIYFVVYGL